MNQVKASDQSATIVCRLVNIRVVWQGCINGGFSAIAEEAAGGYAKGDVVARINNEIKNLPSVLRVFPKPTHYEL